jgi:hypothetical protein
MSTEEPSKRTPVTKGMPGPFGFILLILGIILMAQQLGGFTFENWWALFILIPALSAFGSAVAMWQRDRRLHFGIWSAFYGGIMPLFVAIMFLFDLDWGVWWPMFIILAGFGIMLSGLPFSRPENVKVPGALLGHRPWPFFIGLGALLLGLTFLGERMGWLDPAALIPFENWWGIFILVAALGGFVTAALLFIKRHSSWLVLLSLAGGAAVALPGLIAIFELDWNYMNFIFPIMLILVGVGLLFGLGNRIRE